MIINESLEKRLLSQFKETHTTLEDILTKETITDEDVVGFVYYISKQLTKKVMNNGTYPGDSNTETALQTVFSVGLLNLFLTMFTYKEFKEGVDNIINKENNIQKFSVAHEMLELLCILWATVDFVSEKLLQGADTKSFESNIDKIINFALDNGEMIQISFIMSCIPFIIEYVMNSNKIKEIVKSFNRTLSDSNASIYKSCKNEFYMFNREKSNENLINALCAVHDLSLNVSMHITQAVSFSKKEYANMSRCTSTSVTPTNLDFLCSIAAIAIATIVLLSPESKMLIASRIVNM